MKAKDKTKEQVLDDLKVLRHRITESEATETERKRMHEVLWETEERYRQFVEDSPNPIFSIDREGIVQMWNRACEQIFQYQSEEILGQIYHKLLWNSESYPTIEIMLDQVWHGYSLHKQDMLYRSKDGTPRFTISRLYPLRDLDGNVQGCVFDNTDITARRQMEEALKIKDLAIASSINGIFLADLDAKITYINKAFLNILGYEVERAILGETPFEFVPDDEQETISSVIETVLIEGKCAREIKALKKDASVINIHFSANLVKDEHDKPVCIMGSFIDITERKWSEESLREQTRELVLLNDMNTLLQACRFEEEIHRVVASVCKQLFPQDSGFAYIMDDSRTLVKEVAYWGTPPPEPRVFGVDDCWALRLERMHFIEDLTTGLLCSHVTSPPEYGYLCVPISAAGGALGMLHFCFGKGESYSTKDRHSRMMELKRVMVTRVVEQYSLALINLRLRESLRLESIHDPLTSLYNRRHMEASLEREVSRAKRRETSVAIIMLDIDYFKKLNDTYGHDAGDIVLRELATLLRKHIRTEDIACRYGGEEFLLILPDAPLEIAARRAEKIRLRTHDLQIEYHDTTLTITVSSGVAAFPDHGPSIKDVVKAADSALYQAKKGGRDQVVIASS